MNNGGPSARFLFVDREERARQAFFTVTLRDDKSNPIRIRVLATLMNTLVILGD